MPVLSLFYCDVALAGLGAQLRVASRFLKILVYSTSASYALALSLVCCSYWSLMSRRLSKRRRFVVVSMCMKRRCLSALPREMPSLRTPCCLQGKREYLG